MRKVEDISLKKLVKGIKNNELEGITNALSYAGTMTGMLNSLNSLRNEQTINSDQKWVNLSHLETSNYNKQSPFNTKSPKKRRSGLEHRLNYKDNLATQQNSNRGSKIRLPWSERDLAGQKKITSWSARSDLPETPLENSKLKSETIGVDSSLDRVHGKDSTLPTVNPEKSDYGTTNNGKGSKIQMNFNKSNSNSQSQSTDQAKF